MGILRDRTLYLFFATNVTAFLTALQVSGERIMYLLEKLQAITRNEFLISSLT